MTYVTNEISINHTHVKKVEHTSEFHFGIYWWTLKNLKKIRILKKFYKNCWRYHHFTHVYQKPQLYEVQFLKYEVRHIFLSFWANFYPLTPPLTTQKTKIMKKWKKTSGDVIILDLCNKKQDQVIMLTQIWGVTNIIFYHFRPFFALFAYWLQKLKFGKKCNKDLEKLSFYTCTP